jgi:hypothetical protein
MDKIESYLSGLTEAEMNEAGKIEAEATAMLAKGWSREVAAMYLRIIPAIRKLEHQATTEGIMEAAALVGAQVLLKSVMSRKQKRGKSQKRGVRGV